MTHICVGNQTIIGSDKGLSPGRRQAIIWANAGILLVGNLGRNFSEILIEIHIFSFKKMHLKMSSAKWRPFCLGRWGALRWMQQNLTSEKTLVQCRRVRNHYLNRCWLKSMSPCDVTWTWWLGCPHYYFWLDGVTECRQPQEQSRKWVVLIFWYSLYCYYMMTPSNGSDFRLSGPLSGESTSH